MTRHLTLILAFISFALPLFSATVTLSGTITYDKVIYTRPDTNLDETTIQEALYGAKVEALEGTTVLASSETDSSGNYSLSFTYTTNYNIVVYAQNSTSKVGAVTSGSVVTSIYSDTFVSAGTETGTATQNHNVTVANNNIAGAFNIFQQCERGRRFFATAGASVTNIKCFWPADGTYFDPTTGVLYFLGVTSSNSDPDEFDDDVVLHEFGHFVAENISLDHSLGGQHSIFGEVDMRLAWSEGLATFISCAIRNDPVYVDSAGSTVSGKTITSNYDNSQPSSRSKYSTNEVAVSYVLWNAFKLDTSINNILSSLQQFKSLPSNLSGEQISLDTFHDLYTTQDIRTYYQNRSIEYSVDVLDGLTADSAYQIDSPTSFTLSGLTFYPSSDKDYFQFTATNGQFYSIQTSNALNGALSSLKVYKKGDLSTAVANAQITNQTSDDTSGIQFTATDSSTYIIEVQRFTSSSLGYGPNSGVYSSTVGRYGGYSLLVSDAVLPTAAVSTPSAGSSGGGGGGCFLSK